MELSGQFLHVRLCELLSHRFQSPQRRSLNLKSGLHLPTDCVNGGKTSDWSVPAAGASLQCLSVSRLCHPAGRPITQCFHTLKFTSMINLLNVIGFEPSYYIFTKLSSIGIAIGRWESLSRALTIIRPNGAPHSTQV